MRPTKSFNATLFTSLWAVTGIGVSTAFVAWMKLIGAAPGSREGSDVGLLLWSGWTTLALMVVAALYALRKAVHKLGISPEFKMKVPFERLEEAERRLNDVRRRILLDAAVTGEELERDAERVLRECGVRKVCRAVVRPASGPGGRFTISVVPTEPLGRMRKWLHAHVYLGFASGVVLWVHGGASLQSPLGAAMNVLTAIVLLSGVVGTVLFALGPAWMTRAEKDMNFEDAFVLERTLKRKIRDAYAALKPEQVKVFRKAERTSDSVAVQRTALMQVVELEPAARREMEDVMVLVAQRRRILEDLRGVARTRFLINVWRVVHVPASILLLAISVVHVVSVIWY